MPRDRSRIFTLGCCAPQAPISRRFGDKTGRSQTFFAVEVDLLGSAFAQNQQLKHLFLHPLAMNQRAITYFDS